MSEPPEARLTDPVQLAAQLERAFPGFEHCMIEPLASDRAWGYVLTSQLEGKAFGAAYGGEGVWTVNPLYADRKPT